MPGLFLLCPRQGEKFGLPTSPLKPQPTECPALPPTSKAESASFRESLKMYVPSQAFECTFGHLARSQHHSPRTSCPRRSRWLIAVRPCLLSRSLGRWWWLWCGGGAQAATRGAWTTAPRAAVSFFHAVRPAAGLGRKNTFRAREGRTYKQAKRRPEGGEQNRRREHKLPRGLDLASSGLG